MNWLKIIGIINYWKTKQNKKKQKTQIINLSNTSENCKIKGKAYFTWQAQLSNNRLPQWVYRIQFLHFTIKPHVWLTRAHVQTEGIHPELPLSDRRIHGFMSPPPPASGATCSEDWTRSISGCSHQTLSLFFSGQLTSKEWTVPCCRSICWELPILGIRKSWLSSALRQLKESSARLNSWTGLSHAAGTFQDNASAGRHLFSGCFYYFGGVNAALFHGGASPGTIQKKQYEYYQGFTQVAHWLKQDFCLNGLFHRFFWFALIFSIFKKWHTVLEWWPCPSLTSQPLLELSLLYHTGLYTPTIHPRSQSGQNDTFELIATSRNCEWTAN